MLLAALLSIALPCAAQNGATGIPADWVEGGTFLLPAGAIKILLLEQTGPDLIVKVSTLADESSELPSAISSFEQDGHDNRFGTEVVVIENPTASPVQFLLSVKARASGLPPTFRLQELEQPDNNTVELARSLSRASRLAIDGSAASEAELALLVKSTAMDRNLSLHNLALVQHAQALFSNSEFQEVLQFLDEMEPSRPFDTPTLIYFRWMEATSHWQLRNIDVALDKFAALDALVRQNPEISSTGQYLDRQHIRAQWGATIVNAGVREGNQALMAEGAVLIDEALSNAAQYDDYRLLGELHNYVSGYSTMMHNRLDEGGVKALDLAAHYYELTDDQRSLASIKNNKAFILLGRGRIGEAQQLYREALQMLEETGDVYLHSLLLGRLASIYLRTGDYERAEFLLRESIALMYASGFDNVATPNEIELGITYQLQGRYDAAIALYENLLAKSSGDAWVEESLRIHTELARTWLAQGRIDKAREYAAIAEDLAARVNRLEYRLDNVILNASILVADQDYRSAISLVVPALAQIQEAFQESGQQLELYRLLSKSYFASERFTEALETGRQAIAIATNTRNQIDINRQGPMWSAKSAAVVSQHTDHLLLLYRDTGEQVYLEQAFATLQESRALSLRQARMLSTTAGSEGSADPDQLARLWQQMNETNQALLAASIQHQPTDALEKTLLARQEAYRMVASSAIPAQLDTLAPSLSLLQIQDKLPENAIAVSFHLSDVMAFRFTIGKNFINGLFYSSPLPFNELVDSFADDLAPGSYTDPAAFVSLSNFLLPDSRYDSDSLTLIIEAEGRLGNLPFSTLPLIDGQGYVPAVHRYATVRTNSLSSYFSARAPVQKEPDAPAIAIFADPVFQPFAHTAASAPGSSGAGMPLEQLPYTRVEANSIRNRFGASNPQLFIGPNATISNLLSNASRNARILHIATHGFADTSSIDLSALAFSPDPDSPTGLLTVAEISKHVFNNQLVVISGCDTGQGQLLKGEGIMSLSRAFMAQGAQAVIATLWPISDRATATFMEYFYEALLQNADITLALQTAQKRLNGNPQYRHPYYWSGFTLTVAENTAITHDAPRL